MLISSKPRALQCRKTSKVARKYPPSWRTPRHRRSPYLLSCATFIVLISGSSLAFSCENPLGVTRSESCLIADGEFGYSALISRDSVDAALASMHALEMTEDDDIPVFAANRILDAFDFAGIDFANAQLENSEDVERTCDLDFAGEQTFVFLDQGTLTDSGFGSCGDVLGSIIAHAYNSTQTARLQSTYQTAFQQAGHFEVEENALRAAVTSQKIQALADMVQVTADSGRFLETVLLGSNESLVVSSVDTESFEMGGWLQGYRSDVMGEET